MYLAGCLPYQKNGQIVRQVVGYDRLVGEHAYRQLSELYRALRLYVNCFQPSMKLLSKERDGKKIRCVYDPAKTPLQRLLLSGILPAEMQQELTEVVEVLDPIGLLHQLKQLQQAVFRCAAGCSPFVSSPFADPLQVFSVEKYTAGKLHAERNSPATNAGLEAVSRSGENGCWAGAGPTKIPLRESGNRSCPGWLPILNEAAVTSFGSCSAALPDAICHYKSALYNAGCARSGLICWKPGRSSGRKR